MTVTVSTIEQASELAAHLNNSARRRPALVVTTPNSSVNPVFDVLSLEEELGQFCDIYVTFTGECTRELQDKLPEDQHAYGGAARCYPISFGKTGIGGKLRYVYPAGEVAKSTARLTSAVWAAVSEAGLLATPSSSAKIVSGEIRQLIGDESALVQLNTGDWASIRQEVSFPGVPLSWVFKVGQRVSGKFDLTSRVFSLDEQSFTVEDAVKHFGFDTVTLGWVKSTTRKSALIALHPNLNFEVTKEEITGNPYDVVSEYLGVGDVVPVRLYRDPQGRTRLKMNDIDDDDVLYPAVSLSPGGEPWLAEDRRFELVEEDDFAPVELLETFEVEIEPTIEVATETPALGIPVVPATSPGKSAQDRLNESSILHLRGEVKRLLKAVGERDAKLDEWARQIRSQQVVIDGLKEKVKELSETAADARKAKLSQARGNSNPYDRLSRFKNKQEWFAEELRRAWLSIYTPQERSQFDLEKANWSVGAGFFDGVNQRALDPSEVRKLVRAVLHLVTGRNAVDHNNEAHALLENGRPHMRGGDAGLRMHIENGQPQAKRLHYYKLQAGGFELSKVGIHDDYQP